MSAPGVECGRCIVVTGAGGFVGQATCRALLRAGYRVRALARRPFELPGADTSLFALSIVGDLLHAPGLGDLLANADAVVHLAARVHQVSDGEDQAQLYLRDVVIAESLAQAAHQARVRRFVFLSSIKALAEHSSPGVLLSRHSTPRPADAYGRSKREIEQRLCAISAATGLEVAILRSPLVYGSRAVANFRQMVRVVQRGWPLPLAGVHNSRSVLYLDNLVSCVLRCLLPLQRPCCTLHVADAAPVSTPELLRDIAYGLNAPPRLFYVPPALLNAACRVLRRPDLAVRVLGSLAFETEDSFAELQWRPPATTRDAIARSVREMQL